MGLGLYNHIGYYEPYIMRDFRCVLFIGKPRTGKTTALSRVALNAIDEKENIVWIGDDTVLSDIPEERQADVLYFKPAHNCPFAFNVPDAIPEEKRALFVASFL